jgi:aspartyl aminopeptidase
MLSMHSIREMCHVADLSVMEAVFVAFYKTFRKIDDELGLSAEITM